MKLQLPNPFRDKTAPDASGAEQEALDAGARDGASGLHVDWAAIKRSEVSERTASELGQRFGYEPTALSQAIVRKRVALDYAAERAARLQQCSDVATASPLGASLRVATGACTALPVVSAGLLWPSALLPATLLGLGAAALGYVLVEPVRRLMHEWRTERALARVDRARADLALDVGLLSDFRTQHDHWLEQHLQSQRAAYRRGHQAGDLLRALRTAPDTAGELRQSRADSGVFRLPAGVSR